MTELISIEQAHRLTLEQARRLDVEPVAIADAAGRILAEPARAAVDLPPFPSSAMDGFAVRSADTENAPVTLPVVARIAAGHPAAEPLAPGSAMAVATGGVVPAGADAVVPLERVDETDARVTLRDPVPAGANVRERGGDVRTGSAVLEAGVRLGPAQIAALGAAGLAELRCARRPRVGILVTGSELRPPGAALAPGQIYESNGALLAAALRLAGAVPTELGVVADDADEHRRAIERALAEFDVLVTSGGASVGPHDLVREIQRQVGVEELFWGVAIKPGKPVAFGVWRDHLVFNLPGNPVSVLVTFEVFVRPAIAALLGASDPLPAYRRGTLAAPVRRNERRHEFVRARTRREGDEEVLEPLAGQESHMIVRAAQADALVSVEPGDGEIPVGAAVRFLPLG